MKNKNAEIFCSHKFRIPDIVKFFLHQHFTPHHTGKARNKYNSQCNNQIICARSDNRHKANSKQHARKGRQYIIDTHQHRIQPASIVGCNRPCQCTDSGAHKHNTKGNKKTGRSAFHDTAENISAELVRSKQMRKRRCLILFQHVHFIHRIRRIEQPDYCH